MESFALSVISEMQKWRHFLKILILELCCVQIYTTLFSKKQQCWKCSRQERVHAGRTTKTEIKQVVNNLKFFFNHLDQLDLF